MLYLLACGKISSRTANMLSVPFFAIQSCGLSETSVTAVAKAIENSSAFLMDVFSLLLITQPNFWFLRFLRRVKKFVTFVRLVSVSAMIIGLKERASFRDSE